MSKQQSLSLRTHTEELVRRIPYDLDYSMVQRDRGMSQRFEGTVWTDTKPVLLNTPLNKEEPPLQEQYLTTDLKTAANAIRDRLQELQDVCGAGDVARYCIGHKKFCISMMYRPSWFKHKKVLLVELFEVENCLDRSGIVTEERIDV